MTVFCVWLLLVGAAVNFQRRLEQRTNIKFCHKLGWGPLRTWRALKHVYQNGTLSMTQVRMWLKRFRAGSDNVKDLPRSGCPSTRQAKVQQIAAAVGEDRRKTLAQLSREVDLPATSVQRVLTKDLNLTKIAPKFVLHILNDRQHAHRVAICHQNLESVRTEKYFLEKIITGDECWVSCYENESKIESCEWVFRGEPRIRPIKALRLPSPKKVMLILFCDFSGPLLIHYVPKDETVDSDYYISILKKLKDRIRHKRPGMWQGGPMVKLTAIFICTKTMPPPMSQLQHWDSLGQTTSSSCHILSTVQIWLLVIFFIFPYLKKQLRGRRFPNLEALKNEIKCVLTNMSEDLFEMAIRNLAVRWKKCEAAEGHYFEGRKLEIDDISEAEVTMEESASEPDTPTSDDGSDSD